MRKRSASPVAQLLRELGETGEVADRPLVEGLVDLPTRNGRSSDRRQRLGEALARQPEQVGRGRRR